VNRELLRHVALPLLFVTVSLLGGLRFVGPENELRFVPPPLATLLLATFLVALFARAGLLDIRRDWLGEERTPLENASNALTLLTLYAATVQVFNAVLPEDTLFNAVFTLFFLLIFWNNAFVILRPARFLKGLGGLLLASFVVKYILLVALFEPSESLAKTIVQALLRGVTLGALESEPYARATGYTAFAAVALYIVGLWAASPPPGRGDLLYEMLLERGRLSPAEERRVLAALAPARRGEIEDAIDAEIEEEAR
jgi:hypothetical protein